MKDEYDFSEGKRGAIDPIMSKDKPAHLGVDSPEEVDEYDIFSSWLMDKKRRHWNIDNKNLAWAAWLAGKESGKKKD